MPLVPSHFILLQRNLFYTGITRAKKQVILVGSKKAMQMAVSNDKTRKRYSLLAERLQDEQNFN
jgi:exodeoxyribonuclease V alpha subunit